MANQKSSDLSDKNVIEKEPTFEDILNEATDTLKEYFGDKFDAFDMYIDAKLKAMHDRLKGK